MSPSFPPSLSLAVGGHQSCMHIHAAACGRGRGRALVQGFVRRWENATITPGTWNPWQNQGFGKFGSHNDYVAKSTLPLLQFCNYTAVAWHVFGDISLPINNTKAHVPLYYIFSMTASSKCGTVDLL